MNYQPQNQATFGAQTQCAMEWTQSVAAARAGCFIMRNSQCAAARGALCERILRMRWRAETPAPVYER
jgi:hypothetical protein